MPNKECYEPFRYIEMVREGPELDDDAISVLVENAVELFFEELQDNLIMDSQGGNSVYSGSISMISRKIELAAGSAMQFGAILSWPQGRTSVTFGLLESYLEGMRADGDFIDDLMFGDQE